MNTPSSILVYDFNQISQYILPQNFFLQILIIDLKVS